MNSDRIRFVVEVVGIVAIVASLIFVGLQMRQTHEIALVTLMQMRSDAGRELAAAQLGSEPLYAINAKVSAGEELTDYESMTLSLLPFLFFNQFENSHFLYLQGYVTEEQWQSDLAVIRLYAKTQPGYRAYWDEYRHTFRSSYADEIDRTLGDGAPQ